MHINEARIKSMVAPINKLLESRFGFAVEIGSVAHLSTVKEHYTAKRQDILLNLGEGPALSDPNYAKYVLVIEAASIILREISPKRLKRKSKSKS